MKRSYRLATTLAGVLGIALATVAFAHSGAVGGGSGMGMGMMMMRGGMMHGMGPGMMMQDQGGPMGVPMAGMQGDASFQDDMQLVHAMIFDHQKITRSITKLPDGIRTVTESGDPAVARAIQAHVGRMETRLQEGKIFNLFSPTLPVIFENREKITTVVKNTEKGAIATQTTADAKVAAALQAHAEEVSELARDGMAAMMRGMRSRMMGQAEAPVTAR